ncbi:MAG: carboxypeptidase-like regulatory domain-containing protein [Bryobacteraceae bacterium]
MAGWLAPGLPAKERKRKQPEAHAVIAGTVFREPGFLLAGAEVTLTPDPDQDLPKNLKIKPTKAVSDSRGEYAFRVPAAPVRYTVSVRASGFQSAEKRIEIFGDERIDVFIELKAESKP